MEVAGVSRQQKRQYLPRAVGQDLIAIGPPFEHHENRARLVAFANEILLPGYLSRSARCLGENGYILVAKRAEPPELVDEAVGHTPLCHVLVFFPIVRSY